MRTRMGCMGAALFLGFIVAPAIVAAQEPDTGFTTPPAPAAEPPVLEYDLSGPRLGATFGPNGDARSQFGWHFEHQASPGKHGPWFIVETVILVGGVERNQFIPNGTLLFGMRLPSGVEFGVGPSVTLGGYGLAHTGVVAAAGHSFRLGGIRIPLNVAVALDQGRGERVSLVTGWAIRDTR